MIIGPIDTDQKVMVIAEIGNNHEGSYPLAEEMIGLAAEAGADAVKFQTIIPEKLVSPQQTARIEQLRRYQFNENQFIALKKFADKSGICFLSTPFDIESVHFLNDLVPAYKIASSDNNFFPLLNAVASTGKPLIISSGLTNLKEIRKTRDHIYARWDENGTPRSNLAILHCNVSYPTPLHDANLLAINDLKRLKVTVGFSDHTLGIDAAVLSVACGARIVEKHFTISKSYSEFRDHQLSADPQEMKELVQRIRAAELMLGNGEKGLSNSEAGNLTAVRRSIVAARKLEPEAVLTSDDISWVRPGTGLAPGNESKILGKRLKRKIEAGDCILLEDVE